MIGLVAPKQGSRRREYDLIRPALPGRTLSKETSMAKAEGVYKIVEVIGTSPVSWEDAAKKAVQTAARSLRDLRIAEVVKQDMKVEKGRITAFRIRVLLSFKYQP